MSHPSPQKQLRRAQSEARFLAGRHSWPLELADLARIVREYLRGFARFKNLGPTVTVFGSARFKESSPHYALAVDVGMALASEGFTVMTGAGPGIMEAVSRGAKKVGGKTVGCGILLPHERGGNAFVDRLVTFSYFFVRKVMLIKYSCAFVCMPGGFGTLDEMTESITLIQTGKLYGFPVILVGRQYWQGMMEWIQQTMIYEGATSSDELHFLHVVDSPSEIVEILRKMALKIDLHLQPIRAGTE